MDLVIGTAGHIDHGKTSLIKALTGKDADRLPEEKARGITIDLGFAELALDGFRIGFVDVPGHEKFIRNMLAGATGIDAVMFVVAADEGVMPQTREHFEICSLLNIKSGIIVLTKTDLVENDWVSVIEEEIDSLVKESFLESAKKIRVSSKTGDGIPLLVSELALLASGVVKPESNHIARLPVDRSFAVKGHGTVVTGTLSGGSFSVGDEMVLLPSHRKVRVRGIQIHGQSVDKTSSSQRTAVNLSGIDSKDVSRGEVLTEISAPLGAQILDAFVEVVESAGHGLKSRQRVRVHHGASELLARVHVMNADGQISAGESAWVQLRLESPMVAIPGDRFVIRRYSPQQTIGGGEVVRVNAPKARSKKRSSSVTFLETMRSSGKEERAILLANEYGASGLDVTRLQSEMGCDRREALALLRCGLESESLCGSDSFAVTKSVLIEWVLAVKKFIEKSISEEELSDGVSFSSIRSSFPILSEKFFSLIISYLCSSDGMQLSGEFISPRNHSTSLSDIEEAVSKKIVSTLIERRFEGLKKAELKELVAADEKVFEKVLGFLIKKNQIKLVSNEFLFAAVALEEIKKSVCEFADSSTDRVIDVPIFKSITGLSRKYAIPLLEYLDLEKVTVRSGDRRVVIKKSL
jgi:selenocysteine-specific elongation factor